MINTIEDEEIVYAIEESWWEILQYLAMHAIILDRKRESEKLSI
jgi:hypothetical protein